MNYTLHQLQVFLKVTETLSITKAAKELNLSQPAVSIQLKNFQDQFDIPLTEIVSKRLFVTDFGQEIAKAAQNILNEVYAINFKTLTYKGQISGRLKISVVSTGKYLMPYFLSDYLSQNEGVELHMEVTNKSMVVESLDQNQVDFSLISLMPGGLPLDNEEIMPNHLFVVGNKKLAEAYAKDQIDLFRKFKFILREEGSATRIETERYFQQNQSKVGKNMILTSNEAVKQAVIAGLGFSILPLIGMKNELKSGELQLIPVQGFPIQTKWQLVWRKEKHLSPAASGFLQQLKQNKSKIIHQNFDWINEYLVT